MSIVPDESHGVTSHPLNFHECEVFIEIVGRQDVEWIFSGARCFTPGAGAFLPEVPVGEFAVVRIFPAHCQAVARSFEFSGLELLLHREDNRLPWARFCSARR